MNKTVIKMVSDRLREVEELRWIDIDTGQLDLLGQRPAVAFPACLIDLAIPECSDTGGGAQIVTANITLRVAFSLTGATNAQQPDMERSMSFLGAIDSIHGVLQNWSNDTLSAFTRVAGSNERRRDGIKVYRITYQTTYHEYFD